METKTRLTKDMIARHLRSKLVKSLIEHTVALMLWLLVFAAVFALSICSSTRCGR